METNENALDMSNWKEVISHQNDVHLLDLEIFDNHLVISQRESGLRGLRVINQNTGNDHLINFSEETSKEPWEGQFVGGSSVPSFSGATLLWSTTRSTARTGLALRRRRS